MMGRAGGTAGSDGPAAWCLDPVDRWGRARVRRRIAASEAGVVSGGGPRI